jgi:protein ImuB
VRAPITRKVVPLPARRRKAPETLTALALPLASAIEARELWLSVHCPQLPLEALVNPTTCLAVVEPQGGAQYVVASSESATRAGVRVGMSWAAASALVPELEACVREPHREQIRLTELAALAQRYSPRVTLMPPDALLLEVKGSLRLFGGAAQLVRSLQADCLGRGSRAHLALAPTPLAALAGARSGRTLHVLEPARLIGALAPLPLAVLRWPPDALERLAKVGVRTIGQALRLPRAGFARRFGVELLTGLDRLTGRRADVYRSFQGPERFRARRDFAYEVQEHERILAALEPLLRKLDRRLLIRQCGITELECRLHHAHAPPTICLLRLTTPTSDPERLRALLAERLAGSSLPEPARAGELLCAELLPRDFVSGALWQPGEQGGEAASPASALIERLRARLGFEAVHGLAIHPTHRPEAASRRREPTAPMSTTEQRVPCAKMRRPLWLLPEPELLPEHDGLPRRGGPLRLTGEPERIESSWWESVEVARDYYCAVDTHGVRLWIYRERATPHRWYLHGVLG